MKSRKPKTFWWNKPKAPKAPYPSDLNQVLLEARLLDLIDVPKDSIHFNGTPVKSKFSLFAS
jgi:hypothetical protein